MALFTDDRAVYAVLGKLLSDLASDEDAVRQHRRADTIVQYALKAPAAVMTLELRQEVVQLDLGRTHLRPEVIYAMDADTAFGVLGGEINLTVALARGDVRVRGPVDKALKVVPLISTTAPRLKAQLEDQPLEEALAAAAAAAEAEAVERAARQAKEAEAEAAAQAAADAAPPAPIPVPDASVAAEPAAEAPAAEPEAEAEAPAPEAPAAEPEATAPVVEPESPAVESAPDPAPEAEAPLGPDPAPEAPSGEPPAS